VEHTTTSRFKNARVDDATVKILASPFGSYRISNNHECRQDNEVYWKLVLISKDIMEQYIKQVERLRRDFKDISLEDNE